AVTRTARLQFDPPPNEWDGSAIIANVTLAPREKHQLLLTAEFCEGESRLDLRVGFDDTCVRAVADLKLARTPACLVSSSNSPFNCWLDRSFADTQMLVTKTPYGPYPSAGVPCYSTVFGRHGLITAFEYLWMDSELACGVLRFLANSQ